MEFTTLAPEVTSALIHSGPGAESLVVASGAWQRLSGELEDSARHWAAVLTSLGQAWHGPSCAAMLRAVVPYVAWLHTTAQHVHQTAVSAQAAAAAFNAVRAAVVPTAQVATNRMRLAHLLATNGFGRNLPAIAETESEYQAMWSGNAAAMTRYRAASAQAGALPQFTSPPSAADLAGSTAQAKTAATAEAVTAQSASSGLTNWNNFVQEYFGGDYGAVGGLDVPFLGNNSNAVLGLNSNLGNTIFSSGFPVNLLSYLAQSQSAQALQGVNSQIGQGVAEGLGALGGAGGLGRVGLGALSPGALGAAGLGQASTTATGVAVSIGNLSAPPAVVGLVSGSQAPVQLAAAATPLGAGASAMPTLPPIMPPPISPAGSGWRKRKQQKYDDIAIGAELTGNVMRPPPSAG